MAELLIIDDDPQIRDVLRIALRQAGHQVSEAGDGAEGLAKARSGRFDLIVLDIGLLEMDGLDLCRRLRSEDQTPVLFLTARDDEIDRGSDVIARHAHVHQARDGLGRVVCVQGAKDQVAR